MTDRMPAGYRIASDGLRARENGLWGKEKLTFLDDFVPPALQATGATRWPKLQRWYVDLFAGPGRNVDPDTGEEFEGSAIRVLPMAALGDKRVHFTHAVLVNKDSNDQKALTERVTRLRAEGRCPIPGSSLQFHTHDANRLVDRIMSGIDQRAYALVFADITNPSQWPWSSVKQIKARNHESVDFYMLFPLGMAINRMLSYRAETVEESSRVLNAFFGTDQWRPFVADRKTDAQSPELRRRVLELYMDRLRMLGWAYVIVAKDIKREGNISMYHMLYASNHEAGGKIGTWSATNRHRDDQGRLDGF